MRTSPRGYTLVEVLIVVTFLGLAGMLIVPAMGQTGVLRTQAAVRTIVSDITFAQSDALAYQQGRAIVFDTDRNIYTLVEVVGNTIDVENNAIFDPGGIDQRYVVDFNDADFGGAIIQNASFDDDATLIFDPLGGPVLTAGSEVPSDGGSIDVVGSGTTFRINVAAFTGRVTVQQIDPDAVADDEDDDGGTVDGGEVDDGAE